MRILGKWLLALGLVAVLAGPSRAQGPGGGLALLNDSSVRAELKLDASQLQALLKFRQDHKEDITRLSDASLAREERTEIGKKLEEDFQKADILKPTQLQRLKQIRMQQVGVFALFNPDAQKALNLSDQQKQELRGLMEGLQKQIEEIRRSAAGNQQEMQKKFMALGKEKMESAIKILNDEQKKALKDMMGPPFEAKRSPKRDRS
jgi:hypothetical protein